MEEEKPAGPPQADRGRTKHREEESLLSETRGVVRAGRVSGRTDGPDSLPGNLQRKTLFLNFPPASQS